MIDALGFLQGSGEGTWDSKDVLTKAEEYKRPRKAETRNSCQAAHITSPHYQSPTRSLSLGLVAILNCRCYISTNSGRTVTFHHCSGSNCPGSVLCLYNMR
jgi:hypothetical protein